MLPDLHALARARGDAGVKHLRDKRVALDADDFVRQVYRRIAVNMHIHHNELLVLKDACDALAPILATARTVYFVFGGTVLQHQVVRVFEDLKKQKLDVKRGKELY